MKKEIPALILKEGSTHSNCARFQPSTPSSARLWGMLMFLGMKSDSQSPSAYTAFYRRTKRGSESMQLPFKIAVLQGVLQNVFPPTASSKPTWFVRSRLLKDLPYSWTCYTLFPHNLSWLRNKACVLPLVSIISLYFVLCFWWVGGRLFSQNRYKYQDDK